MQTDKIKERIEIIVVDDDCLNHFLYKSYLIVHFR